MTLADNSSPVKTVNRSSVRLLLFHNVIPFSQLRVELLYALGIHLHDVVLVLCMGRPQTFTLPSALELGSPQYVPSTLRSTYTVELLAPFFFGQDFTTV